MDEKLIRDAQWRKGASIAYFNALNNAVLLVAHGIIPISEVGEYKNIFIKQHDEYYKDVIANIGMTADPKIYIEKLKSAKTIEELKKVWVSLPQDARSNKDVSKVAQELKNEKAHNATTNA